MESEALEQEAAANEGNAKQRQIMDGARQVFLSAGFEIGRASCRERVLMPV